MAAGDNTGYFIWSNEHQGWWCACERGYHPDINFAGLYTRKRAIEICKRARGGHRPGTPFNEIPVSVQDAHDALVEDLT